MTARFCFVLWVEQFLTAWIFFFHEYGRRVAWCTLKGNTIRWWRKGQRQLNNKPNKTNHSPQAETSPPSGISSALGRNK